MGLFGNKKTEAPASAFVPEKKQVVQEGTVIGQGITFVGTFTADELIDIRGKVEGEIISPKEVLVSKTGKHEGTMDVEYLTVDGTIDSEIHCRNTVTLRDDCQVFGTVETPRLNAQNGSTFHGELILEKDLIKKYEDIKAAEEAEKAEAVAEAAESIESVSEPVELEADDIASEEAKLSAKIAEEDDKPIESFEELDNVPEKKDDLVEFME